MTTVYLNNPNLKAVGVDIQFTKDQVAEYTKCAQDPGYFIKNYCKIITIDDGLVPFALFPYQERFVKALNENRFVISMQSRQMGKTQTVAAYILWYILFNDDKTVAILANKGSASREIMSRLQLMYEYVPKWLQQGIKTWNKGDIELENNCKVFTGATTSSGIRGKTVNLLYIDEMAAIPNNVAEDFFTSTYPTISSGKSSKIIITSTPIGYNHFWKFWNDAVNKINQFTPVLVKWDEHPKRNAAWAQEQLSLLGELKYAQEVECAFNGSSLTLIHTTSLQCMSPMPYIYSKDGVDIINKPEKDRIYVIVADIAQGVGGDYSAFSIFDITTVPYKQVAKYRDNKISILLFPNFIWKLAKEFNDAYILCEVNTTEQVPQIISQELEYENVLMINRSATKGQILSEGFGGSGRTQYGVTTDKKTKRNGCINLKTLVEQKKLLIQDSDTIAELYTFIEKKNGTYSADEGYHDDLAMTLVLFGWMSNQDYFKNLNDINLRREMFQKRMQEIEDEVLDFIVSDGTDIDEPEPFNF